jgi:WD40 repeat protein
MKTIRCERFLILLTLCFPLKNIAMEQRALAHFQPTKVASIPFENPVAYISTDNEPGASIVIVTEDKTVSLVNCNQKRITSLGKIDYIPISSVLNQDESRIIFALPWPSDKIELYNTHGLKKVELVRYVQHAQAKQFSPTGNMVAMTKDTSLFIVNSKTGKKEKELNISLLNDRDPIKWELLFWSPDEKFIATSCSNGEYVHLLLFDIEQKKEYSLTKEEHVDKNGPIKYLSGLFNTDGRIILIKEHGNRCFMNQVDLTLKPDSNLTPEYWKIIGTRLINESVIKENNITKVLLTPKYIVAILKEQTLSFYCERVGTQNWIKISSLLLDGQFNSFASNQDGDKLFLIGNNGIDIMQLFSNDATGIIQLFGNSLDKE